MQLFTMLINIVLHALIMIFQVSLIKFFTRVTLHRHCLWWIQRRFFYLFFFLLVNFFVPSHGIQYFFFFFVESSLAEILDPLLFINYQLTPWSLPLYEKVYTGYIGIHVHINIYKGVRLFLPLHKTFLPKHFHKDIFGLSHINTACHMVKISIE